MRTLLLILICAVCATLGVMECRDRTNRKSLAVHAGIGIFIGWLLFKLIAHFGLLTRG